jgi:hypothetical protein
MSRRDERIFVTTMPPTLRKFALTVHVTGSVGWTGAAVAYLALGIAAAVSHDVATIRASWIAMDLIGWFVLVPLAGTSLVTGLVMSLGTPWGLWQHYWVVIALALTTISTVVLVLHMPAVSSAAEIARAGDGPRLHALGGDVVHPGLGLVVLLTITVLNVYKPRGVTAYGRRRQHGRADARPSAGLR